MKRFLVYFMFVVCCGGFMNDASYGATDITILKGYSGIIKTIAFSPDGKILASGSGDTTIILWDVKTGKKIKTLGPQDGGVDSIAFNPDGKILASMGSWSEDPTIILWEIKTGNRIKTFKLQDDGVDSIAFSPDGKILVSMGKDRDRAIILWDVTTGDKIRTITLGLTNTKPVAFSPDRKMLVSVGEDRAKSTIILWDVATGDKIKTLTSSAYSFSVDSVAFSPDGNMLASGGYEGYQYSMDKGYGDNYKGIILWEVSTGDKIKIFKVKGDNDGFVYPVSFSPDGKILASSSATDGITTLWDVTTGNKIKSLSGDNFIFSPDGKVLASITHSGISLGSGTQQLATKKKKEKKKQ